MHRVHAPVTLPLPLDRRSSSTIVAHPPQPCVLRQRWRVVRVNGGMAPPDELALEGARMGEQPPGQLEFGPFPPQPGHCPLTGWARSVLTGTSEREAERAGGFGAMVHVPGVILAALADLADLSFDRRGLSSEVRRACENRCM